MNSPLFEKVTEKLTQAKIEYELVKTRKHEEEYTLKVKHPMENKFIECIYAGSFLSLLNDTEFEKYTFIEGYEAIWSSELKIIECELGGMDLRSNYFLYKIREYIETKNQTVSLYSDANAESDGKSEFSSFNELNDESDKTIEFPFFGDIKVSIGDSSNEFALLTHGKGSTAIFYITNNTIARKVKTIKISNISSIESEKAIEIMQKISNSLFFEIDLMLELSVFLLPEKITASIVRNNKRRRKGIDSERKPLKLKEQRYDYDNEPMSLYWYAKSAGNMPLFQFLAYYQTLEYYFPLYSKQATKQKIQNMIKSPIFNPDRDKDILKIIEKVRQSSSGKSFGNEKEQLKSTIGQCLDNDDLRDFFNKDSERKDFYTGDKGKDISPNKIQLKNDNADLVNDVAGRIYDIRCKIVHTKSDEYEFDLINPFSKNVKKMYHDLELIEFIARKVLIATSKPLNFN